MKELRDQCASIVKELEEGIVVTQDDIDEERYPDSDYTAGDQLTSYDYLQDMDVHRYILNSDMSYSGIIIMVSYGGPNIFIDTDANEVQGYWGNETVKLYYRTKEGEDFMGVHEYGREVYEDQR